MNQHGTSSGLGFEVVVCVCVYQHGILCGLVFGVVVRVCVSTRYLEWFGVWGLGLGVYLKPESVALEWFGFGVYGFRVYLKPERAVHLSGRL